MILLRKVQFLDKKLILKETNFAISSKIVKFVKLHPSEKGAKK